MTGIGQRLREERTRLKLSQSALGSVGGVETNAQGHYESGARSPKADYLARISTAGVNVTYVVTGSSALADASFSTGAVAVNGATAPFGALPANVAPSEHLSKVNAQLQRNLHGIIDALYQMTLLVESRSGKGADIDLAAELQRIKDEAQSLAMATVRLIFTSSRLG